MKWLGLLFFFVLLSPLTPSSSWFWFSLPFNNWQIIFVSVITLGFILSRRIKPFVFVLLFSLLTLKLVSFKLPPDSVYQTCLRLDPNYEFCQPFLGKNLQLTRSLSSIDFTGPTFPLYGHNTIEFNTVLDPHQRLRLPFSFDVTLPSNTKVEVAADPAIISTDQGFTYSAANNFYTNTLAVTTKLSQIHATAVNALALLTLLVLVASLLLPLITPLSPIDLIFVPLYIVAWRGTLLPFDLLFPFYILFAKSKQHWHHIYLAIILFAFFAATRQGCYECQTILPAGSDSLTYEGFARQIIFQKSFWAAGENGVLFYYTPLYRYFLALFHILGGESLWPVRFFGNLIYASTLIVATKLFRMFFDRKTTLISMIFFGILNKFPKLGLYFVFGEYYSESIGLPLLLLSIYLLLKVRPKFWTIFTSGLVLGLSVGTRPNYLPAVLPLILLQLLFPQKIKSLIIFSIGLFIPTSFIILRNFLITGQMKYFNTSGASTLAIGLVDLFYSHQRVDTPGSIYISLIKQTLIEPLSTLIPLSNNFRIMLGLHSILPQKFSFLPVYQPIANSIIYLPVWILGCLGIVTRIFRRRFGLKLFLFGLVFLVIFLSNLPFGVYFNGSAKYYLYILFLTPFAVELLLSRIKKNSN